MKRISLGRYGLPILSVAGLAFAAFVIFSGQPDRALTEPVSSPPTVPEALVGGTVAGAGLIEPSSELIQLSPLVPGVVTRVAVEAGDRVVAGQLLFALDARDVLARLGEAEAALVAARQGTATARVERETAARQAALIAAVTDREAVSEAQRIDARQRVAAAEARLAEAEAAVARAVAAVESARVEAARREVRAPRAGEILQVRTRPGQYVTAGPGPQSSEPPITMGETRPLHVRIDVDETEIARLAPEGTAFVSPRGRADRQVEARYVRTEPLVIPKRSLTNQASERVDVRVLQRIYALPDTAGDMFRVGQQVDAFLPAVPSAPAPSASQASAGPAQ